MLHISIRIPRGCTVCIDQVKVPNRAAQNEPHFNVGKTKSFKVRLLGTQGRSGETDGLHLLLPDTSSGSEREGPMCQLLVSIVAVTTEPSFRDEFIGILEVCRIMVRTPRTDRNCCLHLLSTRNKGTSIIQQGLELLTPSGICIPSIVSPPGWIVRRKPMGAGGKMRKPSSMQAFRYGRSFTACKFISLSDEKVLRISCLSFL